MAENYNREVQRAAEHIYTVRSETYLVKKGQAAAILAIAVVILVGLVLQLAGGNFVVRMAGAGTVVGGALVIVIIYAVMRTRGPLNYTTYYYRDKTGTEFLLQVVGRRRMAFSGGGKILTLNGRDIAVKGSVFYPQQPWNWFSDADFDHCETIAGRDKRYTGTRVCDGRTQRVMLSLRDGSIDYADVDGVRMRYFEINRIKETVELPAEFYSAVLKAYPGADKAGFIRKSAKR